MGLDINALPVLGLGASLSLSSQPDPVKLVNQRGGPGFVEYAGLVDVNQVINEVDRIRETGAAILYHPSYINFCGSHANSHSWLKATALHVEKVGSPWFAQDCAYCFWQEGPGYSTSLGYFIPPIFNRSSLALAIDRVKEVQDSVPVPIAIEPPPFSFVAGTMPLFSFFAELSEATDAAILLDMGHLVSWEMASGQKVSDHLDELPCERVIEVHIAGGQLKKGEQGPIYIDAHESTILEPTWKMLASMLPHLPNLRAVCFECEGVEENRVMSTLEKVRTAIHEHSASESLLACLEQQA